MEGSSSLQAGPSTLAGGSSAGGEVKLAVEPVHVFTDASANHPSGSSGSNSGIIGHLKGRGSCKTSQRMEGTFLPNVKRLRCS